MADEGAPRLAPPPKPTMLQTNIQQILQSSRSAEEEEEQTAEQNYHHVKVQEAATHTGDGELLDPQIEAVKRQLLQFGISFIDPASLASNHRPLLDTMYLPGLHNMLSVYQSSIVTHQNVHKETDAMAAKYLTDAQLASIASRSPGMKGRSTNITNIRRRDSSEPGNQFRAGSNSVVQAKGYATCDDNLSMATKKFLGKYGLTDNE